MICVVQILMNPRGDTFSGEMRNSQNSRFGKNGKPWRIPAAILLWASGTMMGNTQASAPYSLSVSYDSPSILSDRSLGPLFSREGKWTQNNLDIGPIWVSTEDPASENSEQNILYPFITRNRYGDETRVQVLQFLSWTKTAQDTEKPESPAEPKGVTLFPFFFYKQPSSTTDGYWAFVPIYGELDNRLFKKHIEFVLFPLYARTEKKDYETWNVLYPIFHLRRGDGVQGWGILPLFGLESKDARVITNSWNDPEAVDGYHNGFFLWPFISWVTMENPDRRYLTDVAVLPAFRVLRSDDRDSTTLLWPFLNWTEDRGEKYKELGFPWPLVVFARGEGKTLNRILPFFSIGEKGSLHSKSILWPLYRQNITDASTLYRRRDQILFFLYSDLRLRNKESGEESHRQSMWPLWHTSTDTQGTRDFKTLALLEPIFPLDEELQRAWSPLWTLYQSKAKADRSEKEWSTFLNLAHGQKSPTRKSWKFAYGMMSHESTTEEKVYKVFSFPVWRQSQRSQSTDM